MVDILSPNRPRPNLGLRSSADSESLEERKQQAPPTENNNGATEKIRMMVPGI
jgi:hypothetical protein